MKKLFLLATGILPLMLLSFTSPLKDRFREITPEGAGPFHNELLTEIGEKTKYPATLGQLQHFEEYKSIVQNYCNRNGVSFNVNYTLPYFQSVLAVCKAGTAPQYLYQNGQISLSAKSKIEDFFRALGAAEQFSTATQVIADFKAKIPSFGLSNKESNLLTGMVSVASSSTSFWYTASQTPGSVWHGQSTGSVITSGSLVLALPRWLKKALADTAGFVIGNAVGGPTGGGILGGMISGLIE
jgi:hypothetical protein